MHTRLSEALFLYINVRLYVFHLSLLLLSATHSAELWCATRRDLQQHHYRYRGCNRLRLCRLKIL